MKSNILYEIRDTRDYEMGIDKILSKIINLIKKITGTTNIEFQYYTTKMKFKKLSGKSLKFIIPAIVSIMSFVIKLIF